MNILLQELLNGKKKETTTETKVEDGDVSGKAETGCPEIAINDTVEKVVKRKKIIRKK
jgi:hypothetical protein